MRRKLTAVLLATLLVLTAFGPAAASAQSTDDTTTLDISLVQDPETGNATVTVTNDSGAVEGATVNVTTNDSLATYNGTGEYQTDADGEVDLPNPESEVDIDVEASYNGSDTTETFTLVPLSESLDVSITANDDGTATVNVTRYDEGIAGATVNVSSDVPYDGNDTYETDENGTVGLPEPEQTVNVTVNASDDGDEATAEAQLSPVDSGLEVTAEQNIDDSVTVTVTDDRDPVENATVNVSSDVPYDGNGTYETDADGEVDLPAPEENTTLIINASYDGSTANTTFEVVLEENGGYENFGQWISSYVKQLQSEGYFGFGPKVSDFATENNPGADNKPDHAGPPEDDGEDDAEASGDSEADTEGDDERGPPEHANANAKGGEDEEDDEDESQADAESETDDTEDCEVDGQDAEECEDDTEDEDDEDEGDAPGNSGNRGNGKARGR